MRTSGRTGTITLTTDVHTVWALLGMGLCVLLLVVVLNNLIFVLRSWANALSLLGRCHSSVPLLDLTCTCLRTFTLPLLPSQAETRRVKATNSTVAMCHPLTTDRDQRPHQKCIAAGTQTQSIRWSTVLLCLCCPMNIRMHLCYKVHRVTLSSLCVIEHPQPYRYLRTRQKRLRGSTPLFPLQYHRRARRKAARANTAHHLS